MSSWILPSHMPHQKVPNCLPSTQWGFHFSIVKKVGWRVWFDSPIFYLFYLIMYSWVMSHDHSFDRLASNKRNNFGFQIFRTIHPWPVRRSRWISLCRKNILALQVAISGSPTPLVMLFSESTVNPHLKIRGYSSIPREIP